jgi:molecular chaperone GrpE
MDRTPDSPGTSAEVLGEESVSDAALPASDTNPPSGASNESAEESSSVWSERLPDDGAAPDGEATEEHQHQVERDLEELAAKAEKADEYLVLAQRTKADFENYKRRAVREASLAQDRGVARLAKELLPAIDNLIRAVHAAETFAAGRPEEAAADAESQLASGIKLVHADVLAALARVGIEPFSPAGEQFDPQYHEAVAQHPVEGQASGTVVEVYQQGFRLGETVLRPARVLVAA